MSRKNTKESPVLNNDASVETQATDTQASDTPATDDTPAPAPTPISKPYHYLSKAVLDVLSKAEAGVTDQMLQDALVAMGQIKKPDTKSVAKYLKEFLDFQMLSEVEPGCYQLTSQPGLDVAALWEIYNKHWFKAMGERKAARAPKAQA